MITIAKSLLLLVVLAALTVPMYARADGTTDFVIDPAVGYTIAASGSYVLSESVTMTADVDALTVTADDVTIDLNGHTIAGFGGFAGDGIVAQEADRLTVKNGTVRSFPRSGILCGGVDATVADVKAQGCGITGINLIGSGARVLRCSARDNADHGISTGQDALIEHCSALANNSNGANAGIGAGANSVIRNCTANGNTSAAVNGAGRGITAGSNSVVADCTANSNFGTGTGIAVGILALTQCNVSGNTTNLNLAGPGGIIGTGITAGNYCRIIGNVCTRNREGATANGSSVGISAGLASLIENNICDSNSVNGIEGSGRGITTSSNCIVRGNIVTDNDGSPSGTAYGILVSSAGCTIENNNCNTQSGGGASWGIFVSITSVVIRGNTTTGNETGGIRLNVAGAAGQTIRAERNRTSEATGFSDAGGNSIGTGEDANIIY